MRARDGGRALRRARVSSSRGAPSSSAAEHGSRTTLPRAIDGHDRAFMERRFGHDFSSVRIHPDPAAAAAQGVRAYTIDRHIVLDTREYRPGTSPYRRLLAHELAHVIQRRDVAPPASRAIPASDDRTSSATRDLEREADEAAALVMRGEDARVRGVAPPGAVLAKEPVEREAAGVDGLIAAYQQAGPTCGAASLVSALLIWERQRSRPEQGRSMTASACDLILAQLHQRRPLVEASIAQLSSTSARTPAELYDWVIDGVESARETASQPGGFVSEAEYQHLGLALYLMWSDKSDKLGEFQRMLGLETETKSSVSTYDSLWNSSVLRGLEPGQIAQVDWYVRQGPDIRDPNVRLGDHAFLIGRLNSGDWFLSDQAAGPGGRFDAATREELREQVDRAAWSNEYWIVPASPRGITAKSVRLLASPEQAGKAGAENLLPPGKPIGEIDVDVFVEGQVVEAGSFVTSGTDRAAVEAALPPNGSGLLIEAAPGTFFLYSATPVSARNLTATTLDTGRFGTAALEHDFVGAWLILGDASGKRGNTIAIP